MPQLLSDDGRLAQILKDDGSVIQTTSDVAKSILQPLSNISNPVAAATTQAQPVATPAPTPAPSSQLPSSVGVADPEMGASMNIPSLVGATDPKAVLSDPSLNAEQKTNILSGYNDQKKKDDLTAQAEQKAKAEQDGALQKQAELAGVSTPSSVEKLNPGINASSTSASVATPKKALTALDQMDQGYKQEMAGIHAAAQAGAQKAAAESAYLNVQNQYMDHYRAEQAQKEVVRQNAMKDQMGKYQQMADDFQKTEIHNPWAERSTGDRIIGALAIGLGAMGSSLDGSHQNQALKIINDAIDRDINIQKTNLEKKKSGVEIQNNIVAQTRANFGDERQADAAAHSLYLQQVEMKLKQLAAQYQAPELKANAMQLAGRLQQQYQSKQIEFMTQTQNLINTMNPALTPEQAKGVADYRKLSDATKTLQEKGGETSKLGSFFGTDTAKAVEIANAQAFEALHPGKAPEGPEYEAWLKTSGITNHDSAETRKMKLDALSDESSMKKLGLGRSGKKIATMELPKAEVIGNQVATPIQ